MRCSPGLKKKQFACIGKQAGRSRIVAEAPAIGPDGDAELKDAVKVGGQSGLSASNSGANGALAPAGPPPDP
jgi:hypothetical protein